jgi:hypothetical protein
MQIPVYFNRKRIGNVSEFNLEKNKMTIQLDEDSKEVEYINYLLKNGENVSMSSRFEFQNEFQNKSDERCLADLKSIEIKKVN